MAGLVALDRGGYGKLIAFSDGLQGMCQVITLFGILARKCMGWYAIENMNPVGCVCCKSLTNTDIYTFWGM